MYQRVTIIPQSLLVLGEIITAHLLSPAFAWAPFDNSFPSGSDRILAMALVPWHLIGFSLENEIWPWGNLFPAQRGAQARSVTRPASVQFSSVPQACPALCDPIDCSMPGLLFITNSQSLLKHMSIESVKPSNYLILCCSLLLSPSILPRIRVFSNKSALHISAQRK